MEGLPAGAGWRSRGRAVDQVSASGRARRTPIPVRTRAASRRAGAAAGENAAGSPTGADALARRLVAHGVHRVYTAPGVAIARSLDACARAGLEVVPVSGELAAGHMALAEARLTGAPGTLIVGSGPGATAAIAVVASAFYDSIPLVLITGQAATADLLARPQVRQRAFQEAPTPDLARPIAKACLRPMLADAVAPAFERAWRIAGEGRPGPVLLDLPIDVQRAALDEDDDEDEPKAPGAMPLDFARVESLADMLRQATRPLLLAGQGVLIGRASERLREVAEATGAPVATTLLGVGAIPGEHPLHLGYVGRTGAAWANRALQGSDLVVAIGARLDESQTGTRTDDFVPRGRVVRVDVDRHELEQGRVHAYLCIQANACDLLDALLPCLEGSPGGATAAWLEQIARWRHDLPNDAQRPGRGVPPADFFRALGAATRGERLVVVTGAGLHQIWAARHLAFDHPQRVLLTPGGHATAQAAIPGAMGACRARPGTPVVAVIGDGGLARSLSELAALAQSRLPVKLLLLDNGRLAGLAQLEGGGPVALAAPPLDALALARALGLEAIDHPEGAADAACLRSWLRARGPALLRVPVDPAAEISPLLRPGQTLDAMWPWHDL